MISGFGAGSNSYLPGAKWEIKSESERNTLNYSQSDHDFA